MKVKATLSFAGEICMAMNEVRDVREDIAAPLLTCGYLIPAEDLDKKDERENNHTDADAEEKETEKKDKRGKHAARTNAEEKEVG